MTKLPAHLDAGTGHAFPCNVRECDAAVKQHAESGRFFVTMGHAGFNTPANNRDGYKLAAVARRNARGSAAVQS